MKYSLLPFILLFTLCRSAQEKPIDFDPDTCDRVNLHLPRNFDSMTDIRKVKEAAKKTQAANQDCGEKVMEWGNHNKRAAELSQPDSLWEDFQEIIGGTTFGIIIGLFLAP